jgi:hypothetical protein
LIPERVVRALDRRRSGAAGYHKQQPREPDWRAELENDFPEPDELESI